jgi:hypothetical protein
MPNELRRLGIDWESTPTTNEARAERTRGWSARGVEVYRKQMLGHTYAYSDYSKIGRESNAPLMSDPAVRLAAAQGTLLAIRGARYRELNRMLDSRRAIDGVRIKDLARSPSPLAHTVKRAISTRDRVRARTDTMVGKVGTNLFRTQPMDPRQDIMELEQAIESLLHVEGIPRPRLSITFSVGPKAEIEATTEGEVPVAKAKVTKQTVRFRGKDMTLQAYKQLMKSERKRAPSVTYYWIFMERSAGSKDEYNILNPRYRKDPKTGNVIVPLSVMKPRQLSLSYYVFNKEGVICDPRTMKPVKGAPRATVPPRVIARLVRRPSGDAIVSGTKGRGRLLARVVRGAGGELTRAPEKADLSAEVLRLIAASTTEPTCTRPRGEAKTYATVFGRLAQP